MIYIKNHCKDIFIFLVLIIVVTLLQINLLEPQLHYGFTPDDWWPLAHFHFLGDKNLLEKILAIWRTDGVYATYQILYINLLHHFFSFNYEAYQITNQFLKACSVIALYPLIAILFRNRLLAFITSVLYAMAYSPVGTFEPTAKGSDFLSICFLSLFLISYYYRIKNIISGWKWNIFLSLMLVSTILLSPIRMYPLLAFILFIESYLLIAKKTKLALVESVKRIFILFIPYFLLLGFSPSAILNFLNVNAPEIVRRISFGNWQLVLHPFGSFGSLFLLNDYWKIFGTIQIGGFTGYLIYLIFNLLIIYSLITVFYSIIFSIPYKRYWGFLVKICFLNIFFQILIFFIFKNIESIPMSIRVGYDLAELYPVYFAIFILILSFFAFLEWIKGNKKNNLMLAVWIGPLFSFIFILLTWIMADYVVIFKGVHSYLNVPSIGSSLFIGATLIMLYQKIKNTKFIGKSLALLVFLLLIPIYFINKNIIDHSFALSSYSMDASEQENFRNKVWSSLSNFDNTRPSLFYFSTLIDRSNGRFYELTMLGRFGEWMFFQGKYAPDRCLVPVFVLDKLELIKKTIIVKKGEEGFYYPDYCGRPNFYMKKDFYAFELINKQPVDIKDKILTQLGIAK